MTRTFSRRAVGLAASVLVGAALMLVTPPAGAASTTVSFTGSSPLGLAALACNATPDRSSVTLTAADTLNVQNLTGHSASIFVNGTKSGSVVGADQSVPITSAKDYTVSVVPSCLLNLSDAGSVSVTIVEPVPAAVPVPVPMTAPVTATSTPSTKAASPRSDPTSTATTTHKHASAGPRTAASALSGTTPSVASSGSAKRTDTAKAGSSGTGSGGSSTPDTSGRDVTGTTTQAGGSTDGVSIGDAQTLPAADIVPATPSYLLVVTAFILVLGVGWASVRAVFTQRRARRAAA